MTPADYCDAMARWWRYEPAMDPPFVAASTKAIARAVFSEELNPHDSAAAIAAGGGIAEVHAAAWDRAAARLRAHALHAAADAAEETTR